MFDQIEKKYSVKKYLENIMALELRDEGFLHLSANENVLSETARHFLSSKLTGRYYFGGGGDGIVRKKALDAIGMKEIEELIEAASQAANSRLGTSLISFSLLSGIHAMISTLLSISKPGDTIMTLNNKFGGHFMTNGVFERIGRQQILTVHDRDSGIIDIEKTSELFHDKAAKVLYLDMMSIIEKLPVDKLRMRIAENAIIIFDASHTLGLIMGGQFQDPIKEGADIIVGNTHKTFPGPQKAMIAFKDRNMGENIVSIMSKCLHSSVHTNNIIVLAITMLEMNEFGREYAVQIIRNSNVLGSELQKKGYMLKKTSKNEFSQNHQLHILFENISEIANLPYNLCRNNISFTVLNPPSGKSYLRVGTQEVTRMGMKEGDMKQVAKLLDESIRGKDVKNEVIRFNGAFKRIHYSFDGII